MNQLEKIREEGAIELMNSIYRLEPWKEPPDFDECFKNGFDAGVTEHQKLVEPLIEALEKAEKELFRFNMDAPLELTVIEKPVYLTVREALKTYRQSIGEKE